MRRCTVLAVVGLALAGALAPGGASAADKPFRVGVASLVNPRTAPQFVALEERLRRLLSAAGRELVIDFMVLEGDADRYPAAMRELVSRQPDVLIAPGPEVSLKAARAATQTIPIVMIAVDYDAVARGYVQSLARPGGNITGVYLDTVDVAAKRVEILKETAPGTSRFIVLWDASGADSFKLTVPAAEALGVQLRPVEFRDPPYDYKRRWRLLHPLGVTLCCACFLLISFTTGSNSTRSRSGTNCPRCAVGSIPADWSPIRLRSTRYSRRQPSMSTKSGKVPNPAICRSRGRPASSSFSIFASPRRSA